MPDKIEEVTMRVMGILAIDTSLNGEECLRTAERIVQELRDDGFRLHHGSEPCPGIPVLGGGA